MSGDKIDPGVTTCPPRVGQMRRWSVNGWEQGSDRAPYRMGDVFLVTDVHADVRHEHKIVVDVMLSTGMARTCRFDYIVFASDPL